ncbi:CDP-glucose 4,6-dehydratase [Neobacillus niacini]|uniref:CDP-glucose 4,6-dehydratase n=1 Tax=Neobacillus niacini TaxID=86668 RepID=UPI0021CAEFA6|nr:CDP-glucose 4,6-dehydratase [Neobacillus niacini]MCM3765772.1 CDP-glucose 4,6-dehydratase [Neobacillus niacini]
MIDKEFWKGKKVFITGHTGFKGSWLCLWLHHLGAEITGYSLPAPTNPSLFGLCEIDKLTNTIIGDIREREKLRLSLKQSNPDIVFHMAAQPLVRPSYENPIETYETNVMGTAYLFEAIRLANLKNKKIKAIVNVTSDKCYENKEWHWGYREHEQLGGYDPYSNSKACSELITACYRNSFFNPKTYETHGVAIASGRAGNVIGGGDWAKDRLIPDSIQCLLEGETIKIRNPESIRPWQHVLEPLSGYLLLAQKLYKEGVQYAEGWNFGPDSESEQTVEWVVSRLCKKWGSGAYFEMVHNNGPHEAHYLKLDCSKAKTELGWKPKWDLDYALDKVIEWSLAYKTGRDVRGVCLTQIIEYEDEEANETSAGY